MTVHAPLSPQELRAVETRSAVTRRRLANAETPLIRNCWYVALLANEVSRALVCREILGTRMVFYRTEAGAPVALQDRCGHRSFPLSKSRLEGDTIVCGYHGLRYGASGTCVEVPGQAGVKGRFGVQAFPLVERGPFVWIWPGDPALADPALIPDMPFIGEGWDVQIGYMEAPGNYVHLHENLLDLSHLTFLHEKTFGTPEYAQAPVEISIGEDVIEAWRNVECVLPAVYADPLGWVGEKALRQSGSRFVSPGLHVNLGRFRNLERPSDTGGEPGIRVAQIITPRNQHATHYYFALCRNFALDDPAIGPKMLKGLEGAFAEDLFALEEVRRAGIEAGHAPSEFDIPTDKAGVEMRRRLHLLAEAEAGHDKAG
jgi:phenylpropionate dioxygenase-like ring-hydroxylating dioxygenase large terminal subunit